MMQNINKIPLWLRALIALMVVAGIVVFGVVAYAMANNTFIDLFLMFRDPVVLGYLLFVRVGLPVILLLLAGAWLERKLNPRAASETKSLSERLPILQRIRIPRLSPGAVLAALFLAALWITGLGLMISRFFFGIGSVTNLSDAYPWGLWISFDVMAGVALAAGGFVMCGIVHVFNIKRFHPIVRPAVLTAFLGYLLVIAGLMFDLGRWYNGWHFIVLPNIHSPLLEVAWCVTLYTLVLALEFSPVVFEKFNLKWPLKIIRAITMPLVIVGMLLSTLHQSTIGTLFLMFPEKINPLWYTPWLPVLFFISAIAVGLGMTIVESNLSARAFGKELEHDLLQGLGRAASIVLFIYLAFKVTDLVWRGATSYLFEPGFHSTLYWIEIVLGVIVPMVVLGTKRGRENQRALFISGWLIVGGVVFNRLNTSLLGWWSYASNGPVYIPSIGELVISVMLLSIGVVAFGVIAKFFPIFASEHAAHA